MIIISIQITNHEKFCSTRYVDAKTTLCQSNLMVIKIIIIQRDAFQNMLI